MNADVEAEVVYVGAGREADYAGKDVNGKIVLGSGSVGSVFGGAVNERGAAGALGTGSSGVSGNAAGYTLDQIGWAQRLAQAGQGRIRIQPIACGNSTSFAAISNGETRSSSGPMSGRKPIRGR